jgi:DNA polymerase I
MATKKFIIIDANALLHRSFHAIPPLATKKGVLINAVYGFTNVLLKVYKEIKPAYMAVAFDLKEKTFRHKEFKEYKAGRVKAPDEFYDQIPMAKEVLKAFNIPVFTKVGFEADDVIGTVATINEKNNLETIIVTGDKDAFQLITPKTKVYTLRKGMSDTVTYDEEAFRERYGLEPKQIIDLKGIAGDPSDNIPGVRGIGDKGATYLLQKFGSLEGIYEAIEKQGEDVDIKARQYKLLTEQKKEALLSKRLATIVLDVPIDFDPEECLLRPYDRQVIFDLFNKYEFKTMLSRLPEFGIEPKKNLKAPAKIVEKTEEVKEEIVEQEVVEEKKSNSKYKLINNDKDFEDFIALANKQKYMAIDTETTSLVPWSAKLLGVSFSWKDDQAYYINIKDNKTWLKSLKILLENEKIKKCGHNLKYDYEILREAGIILNPMSFDSMIASYLLNPGSRGHSLDNLALENFNYGMQPIVDLIGKGKDQIPM